MEEGKFNIDGAVSGRALAAEDTERFGRRCSLTLLYRGVCDVGVVIRCRGPMDGGCCNSRRWGLKEGERGLQAQLLSDTACGGDLG